MGAEGAGTIVYERLAPPVRRDFLAMTFPAYRHLLDLAPSRRHLDAVEGKPVQPLAFGAFHSAEPIGLLLAELPLDGPGSAEVLSLFVTTAFRGRGVATQLLVRLEEELRGRGFGRVTGVYMTGQPGIPALERVLEKSGWEPPVTRMLTIRFTLDEARRTRWFDRFPLGSDYEVFPWVELTPREREELVRSQSEKRWIAEDLEPWKFDRDGFEPVSSLGVRRCGLVVGWVINHAISDRVVRFTCSYIRKDLGRRGRILPVYTESIRRLEGTRFRECTLTVPLHHGGMARFLTRWCGPWASFSGETKGSQKILG